MELKVKKGDLLDAVSFTQNVVEKKSTMPILANALLEVKDKHLQLSATDLEVGVSVACRAEVIDEGKVTVFAKGLFDIVKELPDELIHIKLLSNNWLDIKCGRSKFKITGMSAEEFPSIPIVKEGSVYTENKDVLLDMIEKTSFAMSNDETRYNLNGVYLHKIGSGETFNIRMVATDGHRLSMVDRKNRGKWELTGGVIIPRKGVLELKKLLESTEGEFNLKIDEKNISVEKDNVFLVIRLIEGQFPPYEQVLPKGTKRVLSVNKENLVKGLRRVSILANDKSRGVKFSVSPGYLEISSSNPDLGEAHEEIEVSYKGEKFEVGFNARFFLDVLGVLEDEQVVVELKDDVSPCVIRSEFDKGLVSVIMPMRM